MKLTRIVIIFIVTQCNNMEAVETSTQKIMRYYETIGPGTSPYTLQYLE
jgi:hypothetical protein